MPDAEPTNRTPPAGQRGRSAVAPPLVAALAFSLALGPGAAEAAPRTVTVTSQYGADKPQTLVWERFAERVEERLPGRFSFTIVTDGALGGEKEEAEGILLGSIDGSLSTVANLTTWVPQGAIFDMPFLFRGRAHIEAVTNGPIGDELKALYEDAGFTVLDFITYGARNVIAKEPIDEPSDVEGLTMRVLQSQIHVDLWDFLGANPTAIPITEAYTALETGVVDFMDMTKSGFHALKLYEVAPHLTETEHIWALGVLYFGNRFWDSLSAEERRVFAEVAVEAADHFDTLAAAEQARALEATLADGAEVVPTDPAVWREAMGGFWRTYADEVGGMERIRTIRETAGE